ncbi:hypothetical protein LZ554_004588 [Drepanopeziza brunnea f. sp. 'monogermtubi']|nr:hypothetical protein LZ554_004588 [Drepanopeziza brunnea f. sp. 'monogermtubi']
MQLTLIPLAALAATAFAQGQYGPQVGFPNPQSGGSPQPPTGSYYGQGQQPSQQPWQGNYAPGFQGQQGPPPTQGGSWQYSQTTVNKPAPDSQYPNLRSEEIDAWRSCMNVWLQGINDGASGSGPACGVWTCLHDKAATYHRGGLLTAISNVLNPICSVASGIGSVPILGNLWGRSGI